MDEFVGNAEASMTSGRGILLRLLTYLRSQWQYALGLVQRAFSSRESEPIRVDFHPSNIFVNGRSLTVIDVDACCFFGPAQDLGYFPLQLEKAKKRYRLSFDARSLRENFLDGYAPEDREVFDRIGCYEARSCLLLLHYNYWTFRKELNAEEFAYWLDMAEVSLRRGT